MRTVMMSFDTAEHLLNGLRQRVQQGDKSAHPLLIKYSRQYRADMKNGRKECPFCQL